MIILNLLYDFCINVIEYYIITYLLCFQITDITDRHSDLFINSFVIEFPENVLHHDEHIIMHNITKCNNRYKLCVLQLADFFLLSPFIFDESLTNQEDNC